MDLAGNVLVLLVARYNDKFAEYTWIMLFLVLNKAFLTLKVFSQFRKLIQMIQVCFMDAIPFMITMLLMIITFALVDLSLDREDSGHHTFSFASNFMK